MFSPSISSKFRIEIAQIVLLIPFYNCRISENFSEILNTQFVDDRRFDQVATSLDHLTRVFVDRSNVFQQTNINRIRPEGFKGITLLDVAKWLFTQCGAKQFHFRRKCMKIFMKILPKVMPKVMPKANFYKNKVGVAKLITIGEEKSK